MHALYICEMDIAQRLDRAMRDARIKSGSELSRRSGVPQATVSRILSGGGKKKPETDTIMKLAAACHVPFLWLLNGGDVEQAKPTEEEKMHLAYINNREAQLLTCYRESDARSKLFIEDTARTADRKRADDFLGIVNGKSN